MITNEIIRSLDKDLRKVEQPPQGYIISPKMLDTIKNEKPCYYKPESASISETLMGFEIKEDPNLPDNMMVAYDRHNQIIGVTKFKDGKIISSKIDPKEFYKNLEIVHSFASLDIKGGKILKDPKND